MAEGRFLIGPEDPTDSDTPINASRVFVPAHDGSVEQLYLVVYQVRAVVVCFFVTPGSQTDLAFYRELHEYGGSPVSAPDVRTRLTNGGVQHRHD